jgi:cation diffusion facilitator CzcD-associated flavoprotein CzcO
MNPVHKRLYIIGGGLFGLSALQLLLRALT